MAAAPPPVQGEDLLARHGCRSSASPFIPLPPRAVPAVKMVVHDLILERLLHAGVGRVADLGSEGREKQDLEGPGDGQDGVEGEDPQLGKNVLSERKRRETTITKVTYRQKLASGIQAEAS